MSNFILNTNTKQVTFLDNRFYQHESGYVPSVTTILNAYPKDAHFYTWLKQVGENADELRDEAGRRGTVVHDLTERYDRGEECNLMDEYGRIGYKLGEWAMFERYVDFCNRFQFDILLNEQNMVSPSLGYAGTIDRLVDLNGKTLLLDIKTSNAVHDHYWLQLAAYNELLTEAYGYNPVEDRAILWLNAKTRSFGKKGDVQGVGWQLIFRDHDKFDNDLKLFNATKLLWDTQNQTLQPKQLSYTITHKK